MTRPSDIDYSKIDIYELLKQRRQVAVIWDIEDVQVMRPDLNDDQAWEVLLECDLVQDLEYGFTVSLIEDVANSLFPEPPETSEEGVRP